jgi:peptidoglycan/xylan/chitin deacetylase (PgdA/CDA1 family)
MAMLLSKIRGITLFLILVIVISCQKQAYEPPNNKINYINKIDTLGAIKYIALTFDDGPDSIYTPQILDILKQKEVVATFFLIGDRIEKYPGIAKRIFNEGHCLANHTSDHMRLPGKKFKTIINNIMRTETILVKVCGTTGKLFRPPFGRITHEQFSRLSDLGFKVILWNLDSKDYVQQSSVDNIINNVVTGAGNDKVVLFHSGDYTGKKNRLKTVLALPNIIDNLKKQNYVFVKITSINDIDATGYINVQNTE